MSIDRRRFLLLTGCLPLLPVVSPSAAMSPPVRYLSAGSDLDGRPFMNAFDDLGQIRFSVPLPGRGHGIALSPDGEVAVAVARRPGQYLVVIELRTGKVLQRLQSRPDRHFYGHGVFSPDGRWLFTPENDFTSGEGVIGVRDVVQGYRQVREYSSHGIGPHEVALLSNGHTLVVANGGIRTHPDTGRASLNPDSMQSSLDYIDSRSGTLLERHTLEKRLHKNSIRHLTVAPDDQVCCVMQFQGKRTLSPPLVGLHRRAEEIRLLSAPQDVQERMRNYCGSACNDLSGEIFAVSAPRGDLVSFWAAGVGDYLGSVELQDGCGIAPGSEPGEFILSSGEGAICRYRLVGREMRQISSASSGFRWDNHLARI